MDGRLDGCPQGPDANRDLVVSLHRAYRRHVELLVHVRGRFLFGAGEAGCFPNLTKAFSVWLPNNERVRAQGIMWTFARWGGAFTPPLIVLTFQFMSWRWAFVLFGAIGVIWAVAFYMWFRDNPRDHKSVNAGELALIGGNEKLASGHGNVPWGKLIRSRTIWLLWAQYFFISYPWYFYITWLPTFLRERYPDLGEGERASLAIFPLFFGGVGALFCGFVSAARHPHDRQHAQNPPHDGLHRLFRSGADALHLRPDAGHGHG